MSRLFFSGTAADQISVKFGVDRPIIFRL